MIVTLPRNASPDHDHDLVASGDDDKSGKDEVSFFDLPSLSIDSGFDFAHEQNEFRSIDPTTSTGNFKEPLPESLDPVSPSVRLIREAAVNSNNRSTAKSANSSSSSSSERKSNSKLRNNASSPAYRSASPLKQNNFRPFPNSRPAARMGAIAGDPIFPKKPSLRVRDLNYQNMHLPVPPREQHTLRLRTHVEREPRTGVEPQQPRTTIPTTPIRAPSPIRGPSPIVRPGTPRPVRHRQASPYQNGGEFTAYGPDKKTEIFVDSLLNDEFLVPIRRARHEQLHGYHHRLQRHHDQLDQHANSLRVDPSLLRLSYPLTRKDAKKRKEGRFRIRIEKASPSASSSLQHDNQLEQTSPTSQTRSPAQQQSAEVGDNNSTSSSMVQEWKRQRPKSAQRRSRTNNNNNTNTALDGIAHGLRTALSCAPSMDSLLPLNCAPHEAIVVGSSSSKNRSNTASPWNLPQALSSPRPPAVLTTTTTTSHPNSLSGHTTNSSSRSGEAAQQQVEAVAQILKLQNEVHQLRRMSTWQQQQQQQQQQRDDIPRGGDEKESDEDGTPTADSKKKRSVRFAAPLVTKVKHRPYTDPEDIEKLFFITEELDEYEYDRETTDGDQFECLIVPPAGLTLEEEKMGELGIFVAVSYMNRPRNSLDPTDDLMLSPSDLSALHTD